MSALNTMLGVRSHFSIGESVLTPEDIAKIAEETSNPDVVICDTMSVNALVEASKLAGDAFKPRFGVTLRIVDDPTHKDRKNRQQPYLLKLYPQTWPAMQAIFRLLSKANTEENFYEVARLSWDDLLEGVTNEDIILSTGDLGSIFEHPEHEYHMTRLTNRLGMERIWIEMCPIATGYHDRINAIGMTYVERGYQPLMISPILYEDGGYDKAVVNMAIQKRATVERESMMRKPASKDHRRLSARELIDLTKQSAERLERMTGKPAAPVLKQAIANQGVFLKQLTYKWEAQPISLPQLAADADQRLKELCAAGLRKRMATSVFGDRIDPARVSSEYMPRLKYELGVLKDMGFANYFLVVDDLVRWCKANGILVGPGRGSVGGSLVAYLMGITDVDPIRFGLIFERFINPSRRDLPDIDLDFMSSRREEVVEYLTAKYTPSHVAGISNYTVLGSASAMKDVGRVHGIDVMKLSASKFVPKVHGQPVDLETAAKEVAEISRFADDYPKVWKDAVALQGVLRSYGRHAAGVICAGAPITDMAVVERRSGEPTVNWDMRVGEQMGLVKLDILGLSTLDTIARTLAYIKERHSKDVDILSIPLDDPDTLKGFSEGETIGVFQFEGGAARRILKDMSKVNPVTFDDIVAANALNRPGPIDAGLVEKYVNAKNEEEENDLAHPNMEEALAPTFNVIVYQEQVMKVAVDLCGFSLADADGLRKAMGKKDAKIMAKYKDQFVQGAIDHSGMDPILAEHLFDQIEVFAGYAFNKSHAAEYSLISYQCMWLKTHYPVEFFAASLSTVKEDKLKAILIDALEHGIEVLPPDINISGKDFVIANDTTLVSPFSAVKNCSENGANAIMTVRASGPITGIENLKKRLSEQKLGRYCNSRAVGNLDLVGAFANVEPGQKPPLDEERLKDQLLLMPGLVTRVLRADRAIPNDKFVKARLQAIIKEFNAEDEDVVHVTPALGKRPKFMVVSDCPSWSEEAAKSFTAGKSFDYIAEALSQAKLRKNDAYWTGLLKKQKDDKVISPREIKTYAPYLDRELEVLQPPVILTLGSASAKHLAGDLKGGVMDNIGKTFYMPKLDATIVVGFNPAMIFHDKTRQDTLNDLFRQIAEMVS